MEVREIHTQSPVNVDDLVAEVCKQPPEPETMTPLERFDQHEPPRAYGELKVSHHNILNVMRDEWWTIHDVAEATGYSESSASALMRDFRKDKFGGHALERRHVDGNLYAYRIVLRSAV